MMNGSIGVTSEPGSGSVFWFIAQFARQDREPVDAMPQGGALTGRHVLVVDDNETNRKVLHHQLALWGAVDTSVGDAAAAMAALRAALAAGQMYDLVVLDRQMPDVDGLMLAREIRRDAAMTAVPLVLMTSFGDFGDREELRAVGFAACLTKPVKASQVRDALVAALSISSSPEGPARPPLQAPRVEPIHARVLVAEDNVVNQKVAMLQLRRLGYTADAVGNGAEAVAALAAIPYDLVLMDCQMPEVDGFEATRRIRAGLGATRAIPIIAMTANAVAGDREQCINAGMDDYISKPVNAPDLESLLLKWLVPKETVAVAVAQ